MSPRTEHPRRLRVLQVAARYLPDLGGIETHVHELTRRLQAQDVDVTVLATDRTGACARREVTPEGVTVLRTPALPRSRDWYAAPGLPRHLVGAGFDLVHVQGVHTLVPPLAMATARALRIPYVVSTHTGGHDSGLRTRARDAQWRLLAPMLRGSRRILPVAKFERDAFAAVTGLDHDRFTVVPNGGSLPPVPDVSPVPGRVISVGRLVRYKGHEHVLRALPHLRRLDPAAHLQVLGSGPDEDRLQKLAAELGVADAFSIGFVPPADRSAMAQAVARGSVMAALSAYEAHPVAVVEALTLGVPVVGYDVAGVGDLVADGFVRGLSLDASPEEVARALFAAAQAGPPAAAPPIPTWDDTTAIVRGVYDEVLASSRGPR